MMDELDETNDEFGRPSQQRIDLTPFSIFDSLVVILYTLPKSIVIEDQSSKNHISMR